MFVKNFIKLKTYFLMRKLKFSSCRTKTNLLKKCEKKMFNLDEEKIVFVFGWARQMRMLCFYFWCRGFRYLYVSDSWYCQIQTNILIMLPFAGAIWGVRDPAGSSGPVCFKVQDSWCGCVWVYWILRNCLISPGSFYSYNM